MKGLPSFSGDNEGDDGLLGDVGVESRNVELVRVIGDSGLRKGDARGEPKGSLVGDCDACNGDISGS